MPKRIKFIAGLMDGVIDSIKESDILLVDREAIISVTFINGRTSYVVREIQSEECDYVAIEKNFLNWVEGDRYHEHENFLFD